MRRTPLPFRFKFIRPDSSRELIFLPKLGRDDILEVSAKLKTAGFSDPRLLSRQPAVLKFARQSFSVRLMPRGLLIGPPGTFDRLGACLALALHHLSMGGPPVSWINNDYQRIVRSGADLIVHLKGRHTPPVRRFASEVSALGSLLSADEALMVAATAESCLPRGIELMTTRPADSIDLSRPIKIEGDGFLHHVELPADLFFDSIDDVLKESVGGQCPISPLPDSTIVLKGVALPDPPAGELENAISILENWVSDADYFRERRIGP